MKTKKTMALGVAVALAVMTPGLASAHDGKCVYSPTQDDIAAHIDALKTYIHESTGFTVNRRTGISADQEGLEAKALAAWSKTLEEKYGDAIGKLEDIATKVTDLLNAPKQKIADEAGDDILYLNEQAMNCVLDVQLERL